MSHPLPCQIFFNASHVSQEDKLNVKYEDFNRIMEMRLAMGLENKTDIGKYTKKLVTPCLTLIYYLIRFLDAN